MPRSTAIKKKTPKEKIERGATMVQTKTEHREQVESKWDQIVEIRYNTVKMAEATVSKIARRLQSMEQALNNHQPINENDYKNTLNDLIDATKSLSQIIDGAVKTGFYTPEKAAGEKHILVLEIEK